VTKPTEREQNRRGGRVENLPTDSTKYARDAAYFEDELAFGMTSIILQKNWRGRFRPRYECLKVTFYAALTWLVAGALG